MDPMLPGDGSLGAGNDAPQQQDAEASATSVESIDDDRRYSGRTFVLVMVALMAVIAAGLFLASRSM